MYIVCCEYDFKRLLYLQMDEALTIKNTDIAKELCLPPVKLHCSSRFLVYLTTFKIIVIIVHTFNNLNRLFSTS